MCQYLPASREVEVQDRLLQLLSYLESTTQSPEYRSVDIQFMLS